MIWKAPSGSSGSNCLLVLRILLRRLVSGSLGCGGRADSIRREGPNLHGERRKQDEPLPNKGFWAGKHIKSLRRTKTVQHYHQPSRIGR